MGSSSSIPRNFNGEIYTMEYYGVPKDEDIIEYIKIYLNATTDKVNHKFDIVLKKCMDNKNNKIMLSYRGSFFEFNDIGATINLLRYIDDVIYKIRKGHIKKTPRKRDFQYKLLLGYKKKVVNGKYGKKSILFFKETVNLDELRYILVNIPNDPEMFVDITCHLYKSSESSFIDNKLNIVSKTISQAKDILGSAYGLKEV